VNLAALVSAETLGWVATATFVASYFFTRPEMLVRVQMGAAVLWVTYGALVHSKPVVAANVLVVVASAWKAWRTTRAAGGGASAPPALLEQPTAAGLSAAPEA
jgi:hypothetical protein